MALDEWSLANVRCTAMLQGERETCSSRDDDLDRALSDEEILSLNTYDFMAYLGKRVINPGGLVGRDQLLGVLAPKPGMQLLEIGCGTGHAACDVARRYGCQVTAVDISPWMVAQARAEAARRKMEDRVRFEVGDILKLPFASGRFDAILSQAVLMFVDQPAALAELRRVLRPGGKFAGLEFSWKQSPSADVRRATYDICGCRTLDFHHALAWGEQLRAGGFAEPSASEQPFNMLSIPGFLRDEGLVNSARIGIRILARRARLKRMGEIWRHFSRHARYFSYTVLSATAPADKNERA
jgi:SAM-dependent methyltransferase